MKKFLVKLMRRLLHNTIHQLVRYFRVFVYSESIFYFMESFFSRKLFPLVSLSLAHHWVNQFRYFWQNYFRNNFNLFVNLRRDWWYFIIHWQQHQHVKRLMRCFSTTVLILLSNGPSTISSSKHFFCSFSSDFFPCLHDFCLLGLQFFGSFHLVSKFLDVSYSLTACG